MAENQPSLYNPLYKILFYNSFKTKIVCVQKYHTVNVQVSLFLFIYLFIYLYMCLIFVYLFIYVFAPLSVILIYSVVLLRQ